MHVNGKGKVAGVTILISDFNKITTKIDEDRYYVISKG